MLTDQLAVMMQTRSLPAVLAAGEDTSKHYVDLGDIGPVPWVVLAVSIAALLAIDLYRHRDDHVPTAKEALVETIFFVVCGLAFGGYVLAAFGSSAFGEYLSGYLIEKSLSVDNVFVWAMLFSSMKIPLKYQHRVLFYGIFGAIVLRGIFVFAGIKLIEKFEWLLIVFGAFLIITGIRVLRHTDDEDEETGTSGRSLIERFMPVSKNLDGHNFFTIENGKRMATPLFSALLVVEATDVIFAVDSVPAIIAVSHEELLVLSSNAFAILGLRAMYFLLADAKERFHYLNHGLGAILIFVGGKMLALSLFGVHLPIWYSLGIIAALLIAAIFFSELMNRKLSEQERAEMENHPH